MTRRPFTRCPPINAVILAIDPADTSGWAVLAPDPSNPIRTVALAGGIAKTPADRALAVQVAQSWETIRQLPLLVVGETWRTSPGDKIGLPTFIGMGAQWGRWAEQLEMAEVSPRRILRLTVGDWRQQIFGRSRMTNDAAKAAARNWAKAAGHGDVTDDEAEAICIGAVARTWARARDVLPKRFRSLDA